MANTLSNFLFFYITFISIEIPNILKIFKLPIQELWSTRREKTLASLVSQEGSEKSELKLISIILGGTKTKPSSKL